MTEQKTFVLEKKLSSRFDPLDPKEHRSALLLIDVLQDFYSKSDQVQESFPRFKENITRLLSLSRSSSQLVKLIIHLRADYHNSASPWIPYFQVLNPDKSTRYSKKPEEFARIPEGGDGPHEEVVFKPAFDGFHNTNLDQILTKFQIKQVFLAGLITSACVQATAQSAFARGLNPVLIEDCSADRKRETHDAVLALYGGYMYKITDLDRLSKLLL